MFKQKPYRVLKLRLVWQMQTHPTLTPDITDNLTQAVEARISRSQGIGRNSEAQKPSLLPKRTGPGKPAGRCGRSGVGSPAAASPLTRRRM